MEHPIIFLGYNIGDANIHSILNSIIKILDKHTIEKLKVILLFGRSVIYLIGIALQLVYCIDRC